MALCRTKRYTDAHLRRLILFALAQVSPDDVEKMPSYTTLLAANDQGRALLGQQRKKDTLCVVTKPADAPTDTRQFMLGDRIDRIYSLLSAQPRSAEYLLRARPYMK